MTDEFAQCRECLCQLYGILDQRIRDYCDECCKDLNMDAGLRRVPLMEVKEAANEDK